MGNRYLRLAPQTSGEAMTRETALKDEILKAIRDAGGWATKTHGEAMQERGLPDIIACIGGRFLGLEVKRPGENADPLQEYQLEQIRRAHGCGAVVDNLETIHKAILFWPNVCQVCLSPGALGAGSDMLCANHLPTLKWS